MVKRTKVYIINICLSALLMTFYIMNFSSPVMAREFIDTANNWARVDIAHLRAVGICSGYGDNLFKPESKVTRAEFTKFLVYATGDDKEAVALTGAVSPFSDLPSKHWAKGYILLAQEMGLVKGQGTTFLPDAYISREEAAAILSRVLQDEKSMENNPDMQFSDEEDFSAWAIKDIQSAYNNGLITGYPDGSFRPHEYLTRAQTAAMLSRVLDKKGLLYQYNGILKDISASRAYIAIGRKNYYFPVSSEALFADEEKLLSTLTDRLNTRISFNINLVGEIVFARFIYQDKYLDTSLTQIEELNIADEAPVGVGTILSAGKWNDEGGISQANPQLSLQTGKEAAGVDKLINENGFSGQGAVIAIIDSGIDPINQDLQRTDTNARKVVDWKNFSDEGRVDTSLLAIDKKKANKLTTTVGEIELPPNTISMSGQYRYGLWSEEWIAYTHDFDFTNNNKKDDDILVLAVDSKQAGVYDLVFVDTNNNLSLADEVPLRVYRNFKYSYASFPVTSDLPNGFPFVLCDIDTDGKEVVFGYDSNGHGTHVAGIAAANGEIKGVAPNAQLMAIKVADSAGNTNLDNILKAVEYAVSKGANIINISLGFYEENDSVLKTFTEKINRLAENTLICTAIGNGGPGIATLTTPGVAPHTLAVGAGMSPALWENNYGWKVGNEGIWYFNSTGPSGEGAWRPDILAPGSAWSCYPVWTGNKYYLNEGTSMAVPFVSGTAALLMDGMWVNGKGFNSLMIKNAIINSAHPLENVSLVEQGHGMIDAQGAWERIKEAQELEQPLALQVTSTLLGTGPGIFNRLLLPGLSEVEVKNTGQEEIKLSWESQANWININAKDMTIPASATRQIEFSYTVPDQPGLYSALVEGTSNDGSNRKLDILNTIVVPEAWDNNGEFASYNSLPAGQMKRYYLNIPEQADKLDLNIKILGTMNDLQGRVRLHIFDSSGNLYSVSDYAGVSPAEVDPKREVNVVIDKPSAGIWEIVVYSSVTLSMYNRDVSDYVLSAKLERGKINPGYVENEFIIGCGYLRSDNINELITINILDAVAMKPYNGRLMINNRLYNVNNGQVKIHSNIQRESLELEIRKVNI